MPDCLIFSEKLYVQLFMQQLLVFNTGSDFRLFRKHGRPNTALSRAGSARWTVPVCNLPTRHLSSLVVRGCLWAPGTVLALEGKSDLPGRTTARRGLQESRGPRETVSLPWLSQGPPGQLTPKRAAGDRSGLACPSPGGQQLGLKGSRGPGLSREGGFRAFPSFCFWLASRASLGV